MEFVYCRLGRGVPQSSTDTDGIDIWWERHRDAALAAGLAVGGYWRFFPGVDLGEQVNRFCVRLGSTTLPPMVDIEDQMSGWDAARLTDWAVEALAAVQDRTGQVPLLYTYRWFLSDALQADRLLPRWPLGLAAWTDTDDWPDERAALWQYTGGTAVPWAAGNVDLDRMKEN